MLGDDVIREELAADGSPAGIEYEEEENILEPFDPNSIQIEAKVVPMDTLIRRFRQKTIRLSPDFQRNEVWGKTQRSHLIESLILKIPLPMFYVAANEDGVWDVVDGLQRLSTIKSFILGNDDQPNNLLKLSNLEFLGRHLNGKTFKDIEEDASKNQLINTIYETEMRFIVINPGTPEEVKRNIFKRINTGGMPLKRQEIRHALYQGKSSDLLIDLVDLQVFKDAIGGNISDSRMGAREIILRFLAFLILPLEEYKSNMDDFLSKAMRTINCMPEMKKSDLLKIYKNIPYIKYTDIGDLKKKFILAMERGEVIFGEHTFRRSNDDSSRKSPINKVLFEAWSNILCELSDNDFNILVNKKDIFFKNYKDNLKDNNFILSIGKHAPSKNKGAEYRYKIMNNIVKITLEESSEKIFRRKRRIIKNKGNNGDK